MKQNKKSNILDWFLIIVVMFIFGVALVASLFINTKIQNIGVFNESDEAMSAMQHSEGAIENIDNMILFVIIGLSLFTIFSAAIIQSHPAVFFVGLFLLFIAVTLAGVIANAYETVTTTTALNETAQSFPKTNFLFDNFPLYVGILGLTTLVVGVIGWTRF